MQSTRCNIRTSRPRHWLPSQVTYLPLKRVMSMTDGSSMIGKQHYHRHLKAARLDEDLWMVLEVQTLASTPATALEDGMASMAAIILLPIMDPLRIEMVRLVGRIGDSRHGIESVASHHDRLPQQITTTSTAGMAGMTRTTGTVTATVLRGADRHRLLGRIERTYLTHIFRPTREIVRRATTVGDTRTGTRGGMIEIAAVLAWTTTAAAVLAERGVGAGRPCAIGIITETEIETCTGDETAWKNVRTAENWSPIPPE